MALANDEARRRAGVGGEAKAAQTADGATEQQRLIEQRASGGVVYNRRLIDKQKERRDEDRDALATKAESASKRMNNTVR